VYLRIFALSGFLCITGIMTAMLESDWFDYLFTLLCGLHGFVISLASLTTRQVFRKLRYHKEQITPKLSDSKL
jgi:TctA family transporter